MIVRNIKGNLFSITILLLSTFLLASAQTFRNCTPSVQPTVDKQVLIKIHLDAFDTCKYDLPPAAVLSSGLVKSIKVKSNFTAPAYINVYHCPALQSCKNQAMFPDVELTFDKWLPNPLSLTTVFQHNVSLLINNFDGDTPKDIFAWVTMNTTLSLFPNSSVRSHPLLIVSLLTAVVTAFVL